MIYILRLLLTMALAFFSALLSAQPIGAEEQLRNAELRLLAQTEIEYMLAESWLKQVPLNDPNLPKHRQALERLRADFEALATDIELEERSRVVYVSARSLHPKIRAYFDALKSRIEDVGTKNFPKVDGKSVRGFAGVLVELDLSGEVHQIDVLQSSASELQEHVVSLLRSLSPFQPLPSGISSNARRVLFVALFRYKGDEPET